LMIEDSHQRLLPRREFNRSCLALGFCLAPVSGTIAALASEPAVAAANSDLSNSEGRTVKFRDGTIVPAVGQGSWHLAQGRHPEAAEEEALRLGVSLGMTLIDTAELYGDGRSENLISRVIASQRDRVFLVSKVLPNHTSGDGVLRACDGSLARLGTEYLDLYLLHWRNADTDLSTVVAAFEELRAKGKIRAWGVSNFKVSDMEDLFRVPGGRHCATNQVRYNLNSRRFEHDLLPWCESNGMPVMAYTPLGDGLVHNPLLSRIGSAHNCAASAVALSWAIRSGNVIAIPEAGSSAHVKENAAALTLTLTPQELQMLDAAFPTRSADMLRSLLDRAKGWLRRFGTEG
jgi:diketogulonate reductase-like aldo/keto reductase